MEYWVNIRTSGELSKEDLEEISQAKTYKVRAEISLSSSRMSWRRDSSLILTTPLVTKPLSKRSMASQSLEAKPKLVCRCMLSRT